MNSELIVDAQASRISIALTEDKKLIELNEEARTEQFSVGNIYLGKIKKIMPGLNAAFVDVGYEKDAFLHYLDLGLNFKTLQQFTQRVLDDRKHMPVITKVKMLPELEKHGSITEVIASGQEILVQIAKEPISTKGPRLSAEISIAGRFLILIPFADKISVSSKISSNAERARLRQLVQSIKPKGFGVIIRTSAEDIRVAELDGELKLLLKRWEESIAKIQRSKGVTLIHEEMGRAVGLIRDLFTPDFTNIYVNDTEIFNEIKQYVEQIAPTQKDIVKLYKDELPIFDHFSITKQIKSSFGKTISLKKGAYLIIERTEALYSIDVNSGNRLISTTGQEDNAMEVNLAAADEIARQLRLRDMGGIIIVDFIDLHKSENRNALVNRMRENMEDDRARHNILPLSKFGVMQITRQRVRPAVEILVEETCPTCLGKGKIRPSILFIDQLENKIELLVNKLKVKEFVLHIHPFVYAYISKGIFFTSIKSKWKRQFLYKGKIIPSEKLGFLQYKFYDKFGAEIDLQEEVEKIS
ncbi:MAG: Rne/Rng family ribonuclease [Paludibacter sp.]|nr:Rne/Rng family ribonuclease [Paludibacter sp.]